MNDVLLTADKVRLLDELCALARFLGTPGSAHATPASVSSLQSPASGLSEGLLLPETLGLSDYHLGHDAGARQPQPVASALGPRFFSWQLTQSAEESWAECRLHAEKIRRIRSIGLGRTASPPVAVPVQSPKPIDDSPTTTQEDLFD